MWSPLHQLRENRNDPCWVIKRGGHRQSFDPSKVLSGLRKACQKRPVSVAQLQRLVEEVDRCLLISPHRQLTSNEIGQHLIKRLQQIDKLACLRFASVYLEFKDVRELLTKIHQLFESR